jgi:hypothetical protein
MIDEEMVSIEIIDRFICTIFKMKTGESIIKLGNIILGKYGSYSFNDCYYYLNINNHVIKIKHANNIFEAKEKLIEEIETTILQS